MRWRNITFKVDYSLLIFCKTSPPGSEAINYWNYSTGMQPKFDRQLLKMSWNLFWRILLISKLYQASYHRLLTLGEEIAFTAQPKINFHYQIFSYGQSISCLPYRPKFSDFYWVSVARTSYYQSIIFWYVNENG